MQVSKFADFGFRVLIFLAESSGRVVPMREIAEYHGISLEHLRKVVHELSKLGYVESFKGKQGGLKLRKDAEEIRLGDVLLALDKRGPLIECGGKSPCRLASGCRLALFLSDAEQAFYDRLNSHRLSDVVGNDNISALAD